MDLRPVPNKIATFSLTLGILGWVFYILQTCLDLTFGLLVAAVTAGSSILCASILDFMTFAFWLSGILAGHVALGQVRHSGSPGRTRAIWGLVLGYTGMAFNLLLIVIIILFAAGIGVGVLGKIIPVLPRH